MSIRAVIAPTTFTLFSLSYKPKRSGSHVTSDKSWQVFHGISSIWISHCHYKNNMETFKEISIKFNIFRLRLSIENYWNLTDEVM